MFPHDRSSISRNVASLIILIPGVVACAYNLATLEAEFRNGVGSIPVGGNDPSIGRWIV